jgi:hypothetical protein
MARNLFGIFGAGRSRKVTPITTKATCHGPIPGAALPLRLSSKSRHCSHPRSRTAPPPAQKRADTPLKGRHHCDVLLQSVPRGDWRHQVPVELETKLLPHRRRRLAIAASRHHSYPKESHRRHAPMASRRRLAKKRQQRDARKSAPPGVWRHQGVQPRLRGSWSQVLEATS